MTAIESYHIKINPDPDDFQPEILSDISKVKKKMYYLQALSSNTKRILFLSLSELQYPNNKSRKIPENSRPIFTDLDVGQKEILAN